MWNHGQEPGAVHQTGEAGDGSWEGAHQVVVWENDIPANKNTYNPLVYGIRIASMKHRSPYTTTEPVTSQVTPNQAEVQGSPISQFVFVDQFAPAVAEYKLVSAVF